MTSIHPRHMLAIALAMTALGGTMARADLSAAQAKCQLATSKAGVKLVKAETKCITKCLKGARAGLNPYSDCYVPYGGGTLACIGDPVKGPAAKAAAAIGKACTGTACPSCYAGGDCAAAGNAFISDLELLVDGLGITVFCEQTADPGTTKCFDGNAKALMKLIASRTKCYDKCFSRERKGTIAPGGCLPPATDLATAACIDKAEAKAASAIGKACFVPPAVHPACYDGMGVPLPPPTTAAGWVALAASNVNDRIPETYCTLPVCAGFEFGGSCWHLGIAGESCDQTCAAQGGTCDEAATRDVAGSGGTTDNCRAIIDGLQPATAPHAGSEVDATFCGSPDLGIGCFQSFHIIAARTTAPVTTCAADGSGGACVASGPRACACQ